MKNIPLFFIVTFILINSILADTWASKIAAKKLYLKNEKGQFLSPSPDFVKNLRNCNGLVVVLGSSRCGKSLLCCRLVHDAWGFNISSGTFTTMDVDYHPKMLHNYIVVDTEGYGTKDDKVWYPMNLPLISVASVIISVFNGQPGPNEVKDRIKLLSYYSESLFHMKLGKLVLVFNRFLNDAEIAKKGYEDMVKSLDTEAFESIHVVVMKEEAPAAFENNSVLDFGKLGSGYEGSVSEILNIIKEQSEKKEQRIPQDRLVEVFQKVYDLANNKTNSASVFATVWENIQREEIRNSARQYISRNDISKELKSKIVFDLKDEDIDKISTYEMERFMIYIGEKHKTLKGNSLMDKIKEDVKEEITKFMKEGVIKSKRRQEIKLEEERLLKREEECEKNILHADIASMDLSVTQVKHVTPTTQSFTGINLKIGDKPDCLILDPTKDAVLIGEQITIDGNVKLPGKNIELYGSRVVVMSESTIDTSGSNGQSYAGMTAKWGVYPGGNADDGKSGGHGQNAGNVKIHSISLDLQKKLTIISNGGQGGHGEQGGKGGDGQAGARGADSGCSNCGIWKGKRGGDGTPGGQGGNSGHSGNGGDNGKIEIQTVEIKSPNHVIQQHDNFDMMKEQNLLISNKAGGAGPRIIGGAGGVGGQGGAPGCGSEHHFEGGIFGRGDWCTQECWANDGPGSNGATGRHGYDGNEGHHGMSFPTILKLGNAAKSTIAKSLGLGYSDFMFEHAKRLYQLNEPEKAAVFFLKTYEVLSYLLSNITPQTPEDTVIMNTMKICEMSLMSIRKGLDYWGMKTKTVDLITPEFLTKKIDNISPILQQLEQNFISFSDAKTTKETKMQLIREFLEKMQHQTTDLLDYVGEMRTKKQELDKFANDLEPEITKVSKQFHAELGESLKKKQEQQFEVINKQQESNPFGMIKDFANIALSIVSPATSILSNAVSFGDSITKIVEHHQPIQSTWNDNRKSLLEKLHVSSKETDSFLTSIKGVSENAQSIADRVRDLKKKKNIDKTMYLLNDDSQLEDIVGDLAQYLDTSSLKKSLRNLVGLTKLYNECIQESNALRDLIELKTLEIEKNHQAVKLHQKQLSELSDLDFEKTGIFLQSSLNFVRDFVVELLHRYERVYEYTALLESNGVYRSIGKHHSQLLHEKVKLELDNFKAVNQFETSETMFGIHSPLVVELNKETHPLIIQSLKDDGKAVFFINETDNIAFKTMSHVTIKTIKVKLDNLEIGDNSNLKIRFNHLGNSKFTSRAGKTFFFNHRKVITEHVYLKDWICNNENEIGKMKSNYLRLSPFSNWELEIVNKNDFNLSELEKIKIEITGWYYPKIEINN